MGCSCPFALLGLTLDVTVRRRVVQRAPYRCSRSFLLAVCAVAPDMSELLAVVAPHLSWFADGCQCDLVGVDWSRDSVDAYFSYNGLNAVIADFRAVETRHLYELAVVGKSLQKDVSKPLIRALLSHFMTSPSNLK